MALQVEGHGFTITHAGSSITAKPIKVGLPLGFERAELDRTTQANTAVKTKALATLREHGDFTHTFELDTADYAVFAAASASALHTITFPNSLGTFTCYAAVKSLSQPEATTDERMTYDVTFTVTNLNGATETAPAMNIGS